MSKYAPAINELKRIKNRGEIGFTGADYARLCEQVANDFALLDPSFDVKEFFAACEVGS